MDQTTTTFGGTRGLLAGLERLHAAGADALLGIVVATEGSTYQKPGALVLLDRHGLRHGVISGGCLEPELEGRAAAIFASGRATLVDFDTRSDEDLVFGSGTGCRGRVHLLLLPQPTGAPLAQALREAAQDGTTLHLALTLDADETGAGSAWVAARPDMPQRRWHWDSRGAALAAETPALLDIARRFGWFVDVVEHRRRWSAFARAAQAGNLLELAPVAAAVELERHRIDAAIVMSHNYAIDAQHLRFCARGTIGYVGLLGPPARRDALLAELGTDADLLRGRLRAPVGLDLGGSGPEAIALAIAAELQQFFAARRDD